MGLPLELDPGLGSIEAAVMQAQIVRRDSEISEQATDLMKKLTGDQMMDYLIDWCDESDWDQVATDIAAGRPLSAGIALMRCLQDAIEDKVGRQ